MTRTHIVSRRPPTLRRFIYAGLLAISGLSASPISLSAQETARGRFTLARDVHWQNAEVPAGDYRFSVQADGPSGLLTLVKLDGKGAGFLLVVHEIDEGASGPSQLVLKSTAEGSYVSVMRLPEFGITLRFAPPPTEKQFGRVANSVQAAAR